MRLFLSSTLFIIATTLSLKAQSIVKTDTVAQGYYIPLDSTTLSCKVSISSGNKIVLSVNAKGNQLPDSIITRICELKQGSVIIYSEITVLKNGKMEKSSSARYVVGKRNTVKALIDPSERVEISAKELSELTLDTATVQFDFAYTLKGSYYTYEVKGNRLYQRLQETVVTLPPGTKVFVEGIKQRFPDGSIHYMPTKFFVVK